MSKLVAIRSSDMRTTVANVPIKTARAMVDRKEAEWTGTSRSIRLVRKEPEAKERVYGHRGLSCVVNEDLILRHAIGQASNSDELAVVAVNVWTGTVNTKAAPAVQQ